MYNPHIFCVKRNGRYWEYKENTDISKPTPKFCRKMRETQNVAGTTAGGCPLCGRRTKEAQCSGEVGWGDNTVEEALQKRHTGWRRCRGEGERHANTTGRNQNEPVRTDVTQARREPHSLQTLRTTDRTHRQWASVCTNASRYALMLLGMHEC